MPTPSQITQIHLENDGRREILEDFLINRAIKLIWTSHSLNSLGEIIAPGKGPFTWDDSERRIYRAEIDAALAHIYGVSREEFEYILDTFTILHDKEVTELGEYQMKKDCLAMFDKIKIP